jgi:hypothetical protein
VKNVTDAQCRDADLVNRAVSYALGLIFVVMLAAPFIR